VVAARDGAVFPPHVWRFVTVGLTGWGPPAGVQVLNSPVNSPTSQILSSCGVVSVTP
jgi:hypothetical protein